MMSISDNCLKSGEFIDEKRAPTLNMISNLGNSVWTYP